MGSRTPCSLPAGPALQAVFARARACARVLGAVIHSHWATVNKTVGLDS